MAKPGRELPRQAKEALPCPPTDAIRCCAPASYCCARVPTARRCCWYGTATPAAARFGVSQAEGSNLARPVPRPRAPVLTDVRWHTLAELRTVELHPAGLGAALADGTLDGCHPLPRWD